MLKNLFKDKDIKLYKKKTNSINKKFNMLKDQTKPEKINYKKDEKLEDLFAYAKYAVYYVLGKELFDSQIIAGLALHDKKAIEMKTGEGKTLSAIAAVLANNAYNTKDGRSQSYIVSANEYLTKRDFELLKPVYEFLGLSVGCPEVEREIRSFDQDVIFCTHSFIGFRYLQDNLVTQPGKQLLNNFDNAFAIIDEADSVLIDDARTPLVISGDAIHSKADYIQQSFDVAKNLDLGEAIRDEKGGVISTVGDFFIENENIVFTDEGSIKAETLLNIDSLYELENAFLEHYVKQSLKAIHLKTKDVDYLVKEGMILIIDESTGRAIEGEALGEGLHQAIEVKEGLEQTIEKQPVASITFQNLFKLFGSFSCMSGTMMSESVEMEEVYGLKTVKIPTNKPSIRVDHNDKFFLEEKEKMKVLIEDVISISETGQAVLIGAASDAQSNIISKMLTEEGVAHQLLNAKYHEEEAEILERAGELGRVTIITKIAGRGVDIIPSDEVISLGGLFIIGAERNLSRRFDNQLKGRTGRQGNPGESRFYVSAEDNILKFTSGDVITSIKEKMNLSKNMEIDFGIITGLIRKAQKSMDDINYELRRDIIAYDDINRVQRAEINSYRNRILQRDLTILDSLDDYRKEYIHGVICNYYSSNIQDSKNTLIKNLKKYAHIEAKGYIDTIDETEFDEKREEIVMFLLKDSYEKRVSSKIPKDEYNDFLLVNFLKVIDENVKEFHSSLDMLQTGINLRSHNNKSPIEEYKKEAYHLYENLMTTIRLDYIGFLHKISIT